MVRLSELTEEWFEKIAVGEWYGCRYLDGNLNEL